MTTPDDVVRVPPADTQLERELIAALVLVPLAIERVGRIVRPADFYGHATRILYTAMIGLHEKGIVPSVGVVIDEVRRAGKGDEVDQVNELIADSTPPVAADVDEIAERIADLADRRAAIYTARHLLQLADDPGCRIDDVYAYMHDAGRASPRRGRRHELPWETPADILRIAAENPRVWLLDRVIPFGALVLIVGVYKVAGKSTLTWATIASALKGEDIFGNPLAVRPVSVVILTEESALDVADKLVAFGIDPADKRVHILRWGALTPRPTWREAAAGALAKCRETGARILLVDTWARWTNLADGGENKSGPTLDALDALEPAKAEGIAVLIPHHPAKAEGREGGAAARGSSALPGEVDVNLELRPARDAANPNRRNLHVESRSAGTFDLVIALVKGDPKSGKPDRYERIGHAIEVKRQETDAAIIAFVVANPGASGPEVVAGARVAKATVENALPRLVGTKKIDRTGRGRAGSPFLYWPFGGAPRDPVSPSPSDSLPTPSEGDEGARGANVSPSPSAPSLEKRGGERETSSAGRTARRRRRSTPSGASPAGSLATLNGALLDNTPTARDARRLRDERGA